MFKPGDTVVCIDDEIHREEQPGTTSGLDGLTKGQLYTIRWCGPCEAHTPGILFVRVEEIYRGSPCVDKKGCEYEPPYFAWRFRKPLSKHTDITIFKKMLAPNNETIKKHEKWLKEVKELEKELV